MFYVLVMEEVCEWLSAICFPMGNVYTRYCDLKLGTSDLVI